MNKYNREPNLKDFILWIQDENNRGTAQDLFLDYILPLIYELEDVDFFGTEGFDKRFG